MNKFIIVLCGIFFVCSGAVAKRGGDSSGGGNPDADAKLALRSLILDDAYNLKASLRNYLNTIDFKKVSDPEVKATIQRIGKQALIEDIDHSRYMVESGSNEPYSQALAKKFGISVKIAARTNFERGAEIRFDLDLLFSETKDKSKEDQMISVASLALHEHIHHFQSQPKGAGLSDQLYKREFEAYELAGYVLTTAKFAEVPMLEWSSGPSGKALACDGFEIFGVGTEKIVLHNFMTKKYFWPDELKRSTRAQDSDCLDEATYVCYADEKAMVNVPIDFLSGKIKRGSIHVTTDMEDDVPGPEYSCVVEE